MHRHEHACVVEMGIDVCEVRGPWIRLYVKDLSCRGFQGSKFLLARTGHRHLHRFGNVSRRALLQQNRLSVERARLLRLGATKPKYITHVEAALRVNKTWESVLVVRWWRKGPVPNAIRNKLPHGRTARDEDAAFFLNE